MFQTLRVQQSDSVHVSRSWFRAFGICHWNLFRTSSFVFRIFLPLVVLLPYACASDYEPGTPSTYLFDTGASSAKLLEAAALTPKSWTLVPEDNLAHRFKGDAVVLNDRLVVVLRGQGDGAEVYAQASAGWRQRVVLVPILASGTKPSTRGAVRILENNPGAVMLEVTFTSADGGSGSLKYRLTAGQMMVEIRPGEGIERLSVQAETRHVVVPDFFGHDMVFRPEDFPRPRLRLPAENFLLSLLDQGHTQVMCVWQSRKQEAVAVRSAAGQQPAFTGCEIQAAKEKAIWVAVLEGAVLWHERVITAEEAGAKVTLDWKAPFAAKWRADLLLDGGWTRSSYLRDPEQPGESVTAVLGAKQLLVYVMDRTRATPLTTFCPIDVLRNTLGVGPCQYILQTEGLASETNPTPDAVMTWVEKQFSRKKAKQAAEEIHDMLGQMVKHVGHVQTRIERYAQFAQDVKALCEADQSTLREMAERLGRAMAAIADKRMPSEHLGLVEAVIANKRTASERVARLADEIDQLTAKKNALAECQQLGAEVRAIGALQDRTLAGCRMATRWLKQSAAMVAEDSPDDAALAKKIQARAEQMLQGKE